MAQSEAIDREAKCGTCVWRVAVRGASQKRKKVIDFKKFSHYCDLTPALVLLWRGFLGQLVGLISGGSPCKLT